MAAIVCWKLIVESVSVCRAKVVEHLKMYAKDFEYENIFRVSQACAPMAEWVKAILKYSTVLESIKPLRDEFNAASAASEKARSNLTRCESEMKELEEQSVMLKAKFRQTTSEAEALKTELTKINDTLSNAQSLVGKLGDERKRWEVQVNSLAAGLDALPYHSLVAAGFITYLGGFPEDVRQSTLNDWKTKCQVPVRGPSPCAIASLFMCACCLCVCTVGFRFHDVHGNRERIPALEG